MTQEAKRRRKAATVDRRKALKLAKYINKKLHELKAQIEAECQLIKSYLVGEFNDFFAAKLKR